MVILISKEDFKKLGSVNERYEERGDYVQVWCSQEFYEKIKDKVKVLVRKNEEV